MVKDNQVRILMNCIHRGKTLILSAAKSGMSEKTARKYRDKGKLPSECKTDHTWRTRKDPFEGIWDSEIKPLLENNAGIQAKTILEYLQRKFPGQYQDGQLRTLQRKMKYWRGSEGPAKEVFFPQEHFPGDLSASDFTHMNSLHITIQGQPFPHMIYHFVLTYSNWETGTVCFSESFESLSTGFQNALQELGKVPKRHRTDGLTAAVNKPDNPEEFTQRYKALLEHYGIAGEKIQSGKANENGDAEQSHYRFKDTFEQALMLRGSRDFANEAAYIKYVREFFRQRNSGRTKRFAEELSVLKELTKERLPDYKVIEARVNSFSMIRAAKNGYSVHSRLIGEKVNIRLYAQHLEVWYGQRLVDKLPRLKGESEHYVQYRHIIDWLVRKPGAFENYRYKSDLFPSTYFRMAYDALRDTRTSNTANKEYLGILYLAAKESESSVNDALRLLLNKGSTISSEAVKALVAFNQTTNVPHECSVDDVDVTQYDSLLDMKGVYH